MPGARQYDISLPRFSLKIKTSLNEVLQAMGLARLFNAADLSPMVSSAPGGLQVSQVQHEAIIKVR
jgi:serine protease inhibitor